MSRLMFGLIKAAQPPRKMADVCVLCSQGTLPSPFGVIVTNSIVMNALLPTFAENKWFISRHMRYTHCCNSASCFMQFVL